MQALGASLAGAHPSLAPPALCAPSGRAGRGRPARAALPVLAARKGNSMSEADMYFGVDPSPPAQPPTGGSPPWYIAVPAGFVATLAVLRTIGALSRRR